MPIETALWKVGLEPTRLAISSLKTEQLLEDMIVKAPKLLSEEWMLIGRQENTGYGGRVDLIAIEPGGALVLIELKRDRTPREVVAQSLDYAGWLEELSAEEVYEMYKRFSGGGDLFAAFKARFGTECELDGSHKIIVVASSLDYSTERIVRDLSRREIPINVLTFQVFSIGEEQVLSRTWLVDPVETQKNADVPAKGAAGITDPWNGEFYCSFGEWPESRSWSDAVRYGFISAGGGIWYSRTLELLNPEDRIWVNIPQKGFVGVGIVTARSVPGRDFVIETKDGPKSILEVETQGKYNGDSDPRGAEFFVRVRWLQTVAAENAISQPGFFGNQNSVCQPRAAKWRSTVDRLKQILTKWNSVV